jgi:6-phosphogluconolactonase (cycloisomerase 2 family)
VPVGGSWPRHFAIEASGALVAAHQRSGTISLFRLDPATGIPVAFGASLRVDRPACLLPVPRPR